MPQHVLLSSNLNNFKTDLLPNFVNIIKNIMLPTKDVLVSKLNTEFFDTLQVGFIKINL